MTAEVHYNGNVYFLADGAPGATKLEEEIRSTIQAGGGTVSIKTHTGVASLIVGAGIPLSIVAHTD